MSSEIAVSVRDVAKHYLMFDRPEDRLKQMVVPRLQRLAGRPPRRYFRHFAALNGVSFDVRRGETVGIIGRNGCGKSTLLQIVCGTLQPTAGAVEVNGRIAALLELGAGFNPEFTGRENVFMNAAILGLSRAQTEARFDDIARFADIGIFIDQPVKTYSSGMYVRLAFAVAINVDPDILVVDEALAVGDEAFQRKCYARIEQIKERGGTILFVSHGAQTIVQLCDRAMLIDRGEKILEGRPKTVVNQYQRFVNLPADESEPVREEIKAMDGWAQPPRAAEKTAGPKPGSGPDAQPTAKHEGAKAAAEREIGDMAGAAPADEDEGWFDPNLVSESRVEYESRGARIEDVHMITPDGRRVNVLRLGRRYAVRYRVMVAEAGSRYVFGMQVKTPSGLMLAGINNNTVRHAQPGSAAAGDRFEIEIGFECRMLPGTFLMDVGLIAATKGDERFQHRILDALVFRVLPETELYAVGHFDLDPTMTIEHRPAGTAGSASPRRSAPVTEKWITG